MSLPLLHAGRTNPGLSAALDLRFALDKSLTAYRGPTPSFSRASTGTYFNSSGVLTSAAISGPRFNHTYNGTSWVSKGLLVEEQRTNFSEYSESIENWTQDGATTTSNQASAPDGNSTGDLVAETTSNSYHAVYNAAGGSVTAGQTWTQSVFVKKGSGASAPDIVQLTHFGAAFGSGQYCNFNLNTGSVTTSSGGTGLIVNCSNGWFRISWTATATGSGTAGCLIVFTNNNSTATRLPSYTGSTSANVFVWGGQVEQGSFATSYIRNLSTGSTTRSADVCQITGSDFSGFWNGTEGSIAFEADVIGNNSGNGNQFVFGASLSSSAANNQVALIRNLNNLGGDYGLFVNNAGTPQVATSRAAGSWPVGSTVKAAAAYKLNDFADVLNGGAAITDTSGTIPTVDQLSIGNFFSGGGPLNGHIARLRYYRKRLPNATLQLLSEPDPTLNLQFALNKTLTPVAGPAPSFSRASAGTFFNASGVLTSASINTPRFDHVLSGGQWVSKGLLIEEQRTNLFLQSNSFQTTWGENSGTLGISQNVTGPDGISNSAWTFTDSQSGSLQGRYQDVALTNGVTYTMSIFIKKTTGTQTVFPAIYSARSGAGIAGISINTTTGTTYQVSAAGLTTISTSSTVYDVGDYWRLNATFLCNSTGAWGFVIAPAATGTSGALNAGLTGSAVVYGAQVESGSFGTSYIATTTASVTRSADVCQITGTDFSGFWNGTEGTLACEFDRLSSVTSTFSSGFPHAVSLIDSGNQVRQGFYGGHSGASPTGEIFLYNGSGRITAGALVSGTSPIKISGAYKASDFAGSLNGATAVTSSSGSIDPVVQMNIGAWASSQFILNGHIAKLIYYPARLTNTKLQQLST